MRACSDLVAISLTVNALFLAWMLVAAGIRILAKWRRSKLSLVKGHDPIWEDFVNTHRNHLAAILTDSILTIGMFGCGLYLLTGGNAISTPTRAQKPLEGDVTVAMTMFNIALGRHIVGIVMGVRRMRIITSATGASVATMQCVDHLVSLVTLSFIIVHREDLLTGALLLIMCVDCNLYGLGLVLDKLESHNKSRVSDILRVLQCFLSIAFRLAIPLICTVVSFVVYDRDVLQMNTQSLSIFISCTVFYIVYNIHIIATAVLGLWRACAKERKKNKPLGGAVNDAFFLNYNNHRMECGPHRKSISPNIVCSFSDLDNYLNQTIPPPYGDYRRLPTPRYFRPSLQVPPPVLTTPCRKCSGVCANSAAAANIAPTSVCPKAAHAQNITKPKVVKSVSKAKSKSATPFTAELPTIDEELTGGFSDVSLHA